MGKLNHCLEKECSLNKSLTDRVCRSIIDLTDYVAHSLQNLLDPIVGGQIILDVGAF